MNRKIAWGHSALGTLLAALPLGASALGLGELVSQSALGQPLRLVFAIVLGPGEEPRSDCFRLMPQAAGGEGLPQLHSGRLSVEGGMEAPRLVVTTPRGVNEPVLRVTLQAGCEHAPMQRDYLLLLDPPLQVSSPSLASEPVVAAATPSPIAKARLPDPPRAAGRSVGLITEDSPRPSPVSSSPRAAGRSSGEPAGSPRSVEAMRPASALAKDIKPASPGDRLRLMAPAAFGAAPTVPRLVLASTLSLSADGQPTLSEDALALLRAKQARLKATPEDQDLSLSVEAELVVLDKRLKELQATLDAAQARMRSMESREISDAAALAQARKAAESHIDYSDWFAMIAMIAALAAIAIMLVQRRRRPIDTDQLWASDVSGGEAPHDPLDTPEATISPSTATQASATPPPEPIKPKTGLAYYHVGDTSHHLSVSELAQITEEARVFLTLGHPDKAILALRDHLDSHADTAPAPWLMLLDLYRRTDNRGEYERSAAEFRHRYNAFIPPWEDPNAGQEGPGLEAYPHLVKQICDLWGNPACKAFLDELLYDNRGGNRIGFNLGAYQDIMLLRSILESPILAAKPAVERTAQMVAPPLAPLADLEFELDQDLLPTNSNRCVLETEHPGILERLTLNWGTPHVVHFLESLLFADHTAKSSFGEAALSELMLLHDVAADLAGLPHDDRWEQDPSMGRKSARQ